MYATFLLLLALTAPVQGDAEEAYRQDYAKYTDISQLTDPAAQAEQYLAFLEEGFDERLLGAVLQGLQADLANLTQAGNYAKVYELADKWAATRDGLEPVALALEAAMAEGNPQQIVGYGEKFYTAQSVPQVALILAQNYAELGNEAKVREFGQVAIDNLPISETWNIAYAIVGQHDQAGRWPQAAEMATKLKSGLTAAPEGVSAQEWEQMQLYLQETIARAAYEGGQYQQAIQGFRTALQMNPRSDKSYYFLGESLLKTNQINDSMNAFAASYVISGGYSARAFDMLETIYKANTGGQTQGMEDVIARARTRVPAQ